MTPQELATEVESMIAECRERVEGVGAQQYYKPGHPQKFETMPVDGLFEYAEEELRDLVVYAVMLRIRLRRVRAAIEVSGHADMVGLPRDRAQRMLDMTRAELCCINDDVHRKEYRRAREAMQDGDLDDLPDPA